MGWGGTHAGSGWILRGSSVVCGSPPSVAGALSNMGIKWYVSRICRHAAAVIISPGVPAGGVEALKRVSKMCFGVQEIFWLGGVFGPLVKIAFCAQARPLLTLSPYYGLIQ